MTTENKPPLSALDKAKKILMFIFFPIGIAIFILKLVMDSNGKKADKSLDKAEDKDHKLELEEEKLKQEAEVHNDKAKDIQAEIDKSRKEGNDDSDWHKK